METGWISSLSIATSVNTVSASDGTPMDDSFELGRGSVDACSFPPPPPRSREPSLMAEMDQAYGGHDANRDMPRSHAVVSTSLRSSRQNSMPNTSAGSSRTHYDAIHRLSNSDNGHIGWAEDAIQEPLEQLRQSRYEPDFSGCHNNAGHPNWRIQRKQAQTGVSSSAPRSDSSNNPLRQRPQVLAGLPTSYSHHRDYSLSASLSDSSHSSQSQSHSQYLESISAQESSVMAAEDGAKSSSRPFLSSSPALHFGNLDRPWAHWVSDYASKSSSSATVASNHTRAHSNSLRGTASSSGHSHSLHPSLSFSVATRLSSPDSSFEPSRSEWTASAEGPTRFEKQPTRIRDHSGRYPFKELHHEMHQHERTRSDSIPVSRSLPNLFAVPEKATQHVSWERSVPEQEQGSRATGTHVANTALMITDSVRSPCYLEPYNSCEAIAFPRPRLRSRSLATPPSIVVERVHAAPERFWQGSVPGNGAEQVQVASRSSILRSAERPHEHLPPSRNGQSDTARLFSKDYRLKLHEDIPPPMPPKDSPLPSSGLLTPGPLSATPMPHTAPLQHARQESFDSIELLDAAELLRRNQELEQERRAWREQSRTGVGADYLALRDRVSPCLRDPSLPMGNLQPSAVSVGAHEADTSPIRVHRMWNKDGSEHTVLVVHSRRGHPYGTQRMSVSSPDLGEGRSTGPRRVPLVKQFAQRLGSFAISRRTRRSATSPSPGQNDARKLSQPPGGFGQSLGKERKLVSDETVIIGKPIEPANGAGMVAGQERGREQQATSHEGRQAVEHATIHVARRESLSRYKPAGTKDEIKAQLGEGVPSIWRPTSISPRSAGEEHDTEVDALTWIDPGSNTIMHGKLILPSSVCARQRPEPADRRGRPTFSLWSDGASCSGSRVSDQAIEQASPGRSEQLSPSMLSPQPARRGSAHLAESDLTRSSSMSNETPGDTVVWDASSVNLDDLFFRPPQ